ncbi:uncharacterized protein [Temnothorax nylanderi]|uniref:uncharacterized protein n=1 Tax=Temnothorax nylanderi TaxID=102681 RepID=UPI003A8AD727
MESEMIEFPVIIDESNEVITLFLDKETAAKANQDEQFLRRIINQYKQNADGLKDALPSSAVTETITEEPRTNESKSKCFVWPDAAVLLLIEQYRGKEHEFNTGIKRHNVIWGDIATEMKEANKKYEVTGLQCSTKFAGLRRTYKNIYEQNKKSGNSHSSWGFYSVMDSLIGEKAYIKPLAEASSEGPTPPINIDEPSISGSSPLLVLEDLRSAPKKRRVESILENYISDIKHERESMINQRDEERKKREEKREEKYEERKKEREKMHSDNMEVQKSLLAVLQTLANKK